MLVLVSGATASLRVLAYANPPDPVWAAGIFDDADNVVEFITSATALVEPFVYLSAPPTLVVVTLASQDRQAPLIPSMLSSQAGRAPPST